MKCPRLLILEDDPTIASEVQTRLEALGFHSVANARTASQALGLALDGYCIIDQEGKILDANEGCCQMTGYSRTELLKLSILDLDTRGRREIVLSQIQALGRSEDVRIQCRHQRRDGRLVDLDVGIHFLSGPDSRLICFLRDVTEHRQLEDEREITVRLLRRLNASNGLHELMGEVTRLLQEWSGCEAVGIRLRDGDDFPYFETRGFSKQHVQAENSICGFAADGCEARASDGRGALVCFCGAVACGKSLELRPGFTQNGAFWANSAVELKAYAQEMRGTRRMRNHCLDGGYESLAIIPLRSGETTYGLLEFNDRRKNRFAPQTIALLERLGESVAVAITHRQTQEKLQLQARVLDQIRDTILVTDLAGRITYANAAQARQLGRPSQELMGTSVQSLSNHPFVGPGFQDLLQQTTSQGNWQREVTRPDAGGASIVLDCRAFPVRDPAGKTIGLCGVATDISARKLAELALRDSEATYRTLISASPDPLAVIDLDGKIVLTSPKALEVFGHDSFSEVVGRHFREWVTPEDWGRAGENITHLLTHGTAPDQEFMLRKKNGAAFSAEISAAGLRSAEGQPKGILVIIRDITERKRLEEQLRQAQKMEGIGQLAGGVAHDFNNILTAILMNVNLMQTRPELDHELKRHLSDLESQANRAASLTRQLLLFSRRSVMQVRPLDLNEVVENLLKMLRRLIGEHITLHWNGQSRLPRVMADPGMLEQVAMNLAVNARDAMPNGGRLSIATDTVQLDPVEAGMDSEARPGLFVCLSVSDTGCGMSEEVLKRIFEPFFTTKEAGKGTGLGLATVYGIVKQHHGWIRVSSQVGSGSHFRVFLPAVIKPASEPVVAPSPEPLRGGREVIMVVEDDSAVRKMTSGFLRQLGYEVVEASNGPEALSAWERRTGQVHLLLTDMVMPEGMNGLSLAEKLRALQPDLKVIICSGYSAELVAQNPPASDRIVYVPKPYPPKELASIIRRCLDP